MLSRVADSLYWLSRYIERAGNMARLVEVSNTLLLDAETFGDESPDGSETGYWRPILEAAALSEDFEDHKFDEDEPRDIPWFLTLSKTNKESIRSNIAGARENARMVRDQISEEMWREINSLHLFLNSPESRFQYEADFDLLCQRLINFSLLFQGITDSTLPRSLGWQFMQLGKFIERADKTSRILDIPNRISGPSQVESFAWTAVLGSTSARAAYRENYKGALSGSTITKLLVYSSTFPRSIRFCIREIDQALHSITGSAPHDYRNRAEKLAGKLLASLDFGSVEEIEALGLSEFCDDLQTRLNELGGEIYGTYMAMTLTFYPVVLTEGEADAEEIREVEAHLEDPKEEVSGEAEVKKEPSKPFYRPPVDNFSHQPYAPHDQEEQEQQAQQQ